MRQERDGLFGQLLEASCKAGEYVFVALMWLVPDRCIEHALVKRERKNEAAVQSTPANFAANARHVP